MKKRKSIMIAVGIAAFILSLIIKLINLSDSQEMSALEKYYEENIEKMHVEEKLDGVISILNAAADEYKQAVEKGVQPDWTVLEPKFYDAIANLESQKEELKKIVIDDEKIREVHSYLISSYEEMIDGYKELVKGLKEENNELIHSANAKLSKGQENVMKWEQMLNGK